MCNSILFIGAFYNNESRKNTLRKAAFADGFMESVLFVGRRSTLAVLPTAMTHETVKSASLGYYYAITAMIMWGMFPIYWKWLDGVGTLEVLAHRTIWCALFTWLVLLWQRRAGLDRLFMRSTMEWFVLCASAVLIASNWGLFIWAVQDGQVIEASMGYFLSPLITIMLGRLIFKEQLRPIHWLAIALAISGVLVQIISLGVTPWLGLLIGLSFSGYGALRKFSSADSLTGLLIETLILTPVALVYLLWLSRSIEGMVFLSGNVKLDVLLLIGGAVTAIPLMLFVASTRLLSLTIVGFLFYINPSIQFLIGRFIYNEAFTSGQLAGFVLIWSGLLIFTMSNVRRRKQRIIT